MASKTANIPQQLGPEARKHYSKLRKALPELDDEQEALLRMACEWWENFWTAGQELAAFAKEKGTLTIEGKAHPSLRIQWTASNAYQKLLAQLKAGLQRKPATVEGQSCPPQCEEQPDFAELFSDKPITLGAN